MEKIEPITLPSGAVITFADPDSHWRVKHSREISRISFDLNEDAINAEATMAQAVDVVMWALIPEWSLPYAPDAPAPGSAVSYARAALIIGDTMTEEDGRALSTHLALWALDRMGVKRPEPALAADKVAVSEGKGDGAAQSPA